MAIVTVGSTAELYTALENATGGDRIKLAAGDYGDLNLSNYSFNAEVTIISAAPSDPAVIGSLNVFQCDNLTFDNLIVDFVPDEQTLEWSSAIKINHSSSIKVKNSVLEGGVSIAGVPADSEPGTQNEYGIMGEPIGRGITAENSTDLVFANNDISQFTRGIVLGGNDGVIVLGNEVHDLRTSPLVGGDNSNVTVAENHFYNFNPWKLGGLGDHGDMIHFWTTSSQTGASGNFVIRDNLFEEGDGQSLLGIYFEDNFSKTFKNVQIEDNVIHLGDSQAVRLEGVVGGTLSNNSLVQSSGGVTDQPMINLANGTRNLVVENNLSAGIYGNAYDIAAASGIQMNGNLTVNYDDPQAANYVGNLFVEGVPAADGTTSLVVTPDSAADGVGAAMTQFDVTPASVQAVFQVTSRLNNDSSLVFDASLSAGPAGLLDPAETQYFWTFGDGTSSTGPLVQRTYDQPGNYNVSLKVVAADGSVSTSSYVVGVAGELLVSFDSASGAFISHGYGLEEVNDTPDLDLTSVNGGKSIVLGATGVQAEIAATELDALFGTDKFDLSMSLKSTGGAGNWGEIFRIHGSIIASVDKSGNFVFDMFADDGSRITAVTSGVSMTDGAKHDISIVFDSASNSLKVLVDGSVRASETVAGDLNDFPRSLTLGNPWNETNFVGQLSDFSLSSSQPEYTLFDGAGSAINKVISEDDSALPPAGGGTVDTGDTADSGGSVDTGGTADSGGTVDTGGTADSGGTVDTGGTGGTADSGGTSGDPGGSPITGVGEYVLDIASLDGKKRILKDDAQVLQTSEGAVLDFDGDRDFARIGPQKDYETSDRLSVSVDFSRDIADGSASKIFWNGKKIMMKVVDDGFVIRAGTVDEGFKAFKIDDIGLNDTDVHNAFVLIDDVEDRMQVMIDGVLVLDETSTDFEISGASDWKLSAGGQSSLDGQIYDFRLDDTDVFVTDDVFRAESSLLV